MSIIHLYPLPKSGNFPYFVLFADLLQTSHTRKVTEHSLLFRLWAVYPIPFVWQKALCSLCFVSGYPSLYGSVMNPGLAPRLVNAKLSSNTSSN